jgi:hypothetical protein
MCSSARPSPTALKLGGPTYQIVGVDEADVARVAFVAPLARALQPDGYELVHVVSVRLPVT